MLTKAKRLYHATRVECRRHIQFWGIQFNDDGSAVGFNAFCTDENVCMRTVNDVQRIHDSMVRVLDSHVKHGFYDTNTERLDLEKKIMAMMQSTIDNQRKSLKKEVKL